MAHADVARSPSAQGVEDGPPLGWKPTMAKPLPVVRCKVIRSDGQRCDKWSLRGTNICRTHGGNLENVKEYAEAMVEAARLSLIDMSEDAVDTMRELMTSSATPENVRLKAATEILDRIGVRGGFEVQVEGEIKVNPADEVRDRLKKLANTAPPAAEPVIELTTGPDEILDAEILDDGEGTPDES